MPFCLYDDHPLAEKVASQAFFRLQGELRSSVAEISFFLVVDWAHLPS